MAVQIYPELPDPSLEPEAMLKTIEALKVVIETMLGERGYNGWANQTFFQRDPPVAHKKGDKWVRPAMLAGEVDIMSIWTGTAWQKLNF